MIEGQTDINENGKKILLKKVLNHIVQTANFGFSDEQKEMLKFNIDSTVSLISIGWRSIESGKLNIQPEEVINIFTHCFQWVSKCFKKSPVAAPVADQMPTQSQAPGPLEPEVISLLVSTSEPSEFVDISFEIELEKELSSDPTILV